MDKKLIGQGQFYEVYVIKPHADRPVYKEAPSNNTEIKLFAANPIDERRLDIDKELDQIDQALYLSQRSPQLEVCYHPKITKERSKELLSLKPPTILHFSGHGAGDVLLVEDDEGYADPMDLEAFIELLKHYQNTLECVVFNACYSTRYLDKLAAYIPNVIGVTRAIGNDKAIAFSAGFYRGLSNGNTYKRAFEEAVKGIRIDDFQGDNAAFIYYKWDEKDKVSPINTSAASFNTGRIRNYQVESKGRYKEKDEVECFFREDRYRFFFLYGTGGMGKTHLLYDVINRLEDDYAFEPEIIYFLANRNSDFTELYNLCFDESQNITKQERLYRAFVKKFEREQLYLIVDDFYEISDRFLRRAVLDLMNLRKGKVLVVSRSKPREIEQSDSWIPTLKINRLDETAFYAYVWDYYRTRDFERHFELTDELLLELYSILKGYPLGVKFVFDLFKNIGAAATAIENIQNADDNEENNSFMNRLLGSVVNHGDPFEMKLLQEMAVFTTAFDKDLIQLLPSFQAQEIYNSLLRKDFIWQAPGGKVELHALVRELLYNKNEKEELVQLHLIAARYFEAQSTAAGLDDMNVFKLAAYHYSNTDEVNYGLFLKRQEKIFGKSNQIKSLIDSNLEASIDRLLYRIELHPTLLDTYTELAQVYIASGNLDKAKGVIKKGLKVEPHNAYLLFIRAKIYEQEGDVNNAIAFCNYVLIKDVCNAHVLLYQGILYRKQKRYREAHWNFWALYCNDSLNFRVQNELGILCREQGKYKEAERWLLSLAKDGNVLAQNELGILYREQGKYKEAEKWLLPLAENGNVLAQNELGILYREQRKYKEAEEWLLPLAKKENLASQNELGILYREQGKYKEAEGWLLPLAKEGQIHAQNELGILYREQGKYKGAKEWLLPLAENGNVLAQNELGILYREQRKYKEAEKWLLPLAKKENLASQNELGILYREQGKYKEAKEWLLPLAENGNVLAQNELGILYREQGKYKEAEEWLLKAERVGNVASRNELGILYREQGKYKEAEEWLLKAEREGNIASRNELGILYRIQEEYEEAEIWLSPLANKGNVLAINELAILYRNWGISKEYQLRDKEKVVMSKKWYKKAIALKPRNIHSYDGLAKVLIVLKEYKAAEDILLKGLAIREYDWRLQRQLVGLATYQLKDKTKAVNYLSWLKNNRKSKHLQSYIEKIERMIARDDWWLIS